MHMKRAMKMIQGAGIAALALASIAAVPSSAQENGFSFGPPLRSKHLFAYKYTERVTTVHEMDGGATDSTERVLTYYITQRQIPIPEKKGMMKVEANIDSMTIDLRGADQRITFNTQLFAQQDWKIGGHREVLVPASLVNRMVSFEVSPYGEIMEIESVELDKARKQAELPQVDAFTRARLAEITTDEYLAAVLLPWRMAPLGRKVEYNKPMATPLWVALDRLSFRGTGSVAVMKSSTGGPKLRFEGRVKNPVFAKITTAGFDEPLTVKSAEASVAGEMELESDGVVRSGWASITGTAISERSGAAVNSRIRHEVYIESLGVAPYASN